jgi:NTP pyrophosphatase (non-canonical NTP hydrolase)
MEQQKIVSNFVKEREWDRYHTPKELLLGMVEEIGEFRNIIKWEQDEEKVRLKIQDNFAEVEDFFGDMLWELCSLANYCSVDINTALNKVIEKHRIRFPTQEVKGKHTNEG